MEYDRITIYADAAKLTRQAKRWAKEVERTMGARVHKPVSAYVRHLVARDAKGRR